MPSEPINYIKNHHEQSFPEGIGEYYFLMDEGDSDDAILQ